MPEKMLFERYLYTAFCELHCSSKGQFASLILLKLSANSAVFDIRKTNRDDSYSIISLAGTGLLLCLIIH